MCCGIRVAVDAIAASLHALAAFLVAKPLNGPLTECAGLATKVIG